MTPAEINAHIASVTGTVVSVAANANVDDPDYAGGCQIVLSDGTRLSTAYWRLTVDDSARLSSQDHGPGRGEDRIDAIAELAQAIEGRTVTALFVDARSGDLRLRLGTATELCCFRFRSLFEDWEIAGRDHVDFWSNYITL